MTDDIDAKLDALGFVKDDSDHVTVTFVGPKGAAAAEAAVKDKGTKRKGGKKGKQQTRPQTPKRSRRR